MMNLKQKRLSSFFGSLAFSFINFVSIYLYFANCANLARRNKCLEFNYLNMKINKFEIMANLCPTSMDLTWEIKHCNVVYHSIKQNQREIFKNGFN